MVCPAFAFQSDNANGFALPPIKVTDGHQFSGSRDARIVAVVMRELVIPDTATSILTFADEAHHSPVAAVLQIAIAEAV